MDFSIFFARFFGLYMLIVALMLIIRKKQIRNLLGEYIATPGLIATSGICRVLLGLAVVILHPVWEMDWPVVITLLGYILILSGVVRICFQEQTRAFWGCVLQEKGYWITFFVLFLLGGFLTCNGFGTY